jgi:hypothetical protein
LPGANGIHALSFLRLKFRQTNYAQRQRLGQCTRSAELVARAAAASEIQGLLKNNKKPLHTQQLLPHRRTFEGHNGRLYSEMHRIYREVLEYPLRFEEKLSGRVHITLVSDGVSDNNDG